jgi:hypothetical protein
MPQLEVLTFHFTTYPPPVAEPYPEIDAGLSAIPRLRELNISVEVGPWEVVDLAPYVGHFLARLPHMRAAGLLKFSPIFKGPWRPHDTILFPEAATD